jgi:hypothetical protein
VPEKVGVRLLVTVPFGGCASVIDGAVTSTVNVLAALEPVFPALSDWLACAVYVPSASAVVASTLYAPFSALRDAVSVCTGVPAAAEPMYTDTVTDDESPGAMPAVPEKVGVVSFVALLLTGDASDTTGGVPSTVNVFAELDPVLPALSD